MHIKNGRSISRMKPYYNPECGCKGNENYTNKQIFLLNSKKYLCNGLIFVDFYAHEEGICADLIIILQNVKGSCLQNEPKSLKIAFVTYSDTKGYKEACKRASFALQKGIFYRVKGHVLQCKRASFTMQKSTY